MAQPITGGRYAHLVLNVRDLERSVAFYRMFGGKVGDQRGTNVPIQLSPSTRLLLREDPDYVPQSHGNLNHMALDLEGSTDIDEVLAHVRAHGGEPFDGPKINGRGLIQFRVLDPDGNELELHVTPPEGYSPK